MLHALCKLHEHPPKNLNMKLSTGAAGTGLVSTMTRLQEQQRHSRFRWWTYTEEQEAQEQVEQNMERKARDVELARHLCTGNPNQSHSTVLEVIPDLKKTCYNKGEKRVVEELSKLSGKEQFGRPLRCSSFEMNFCTQSCWEHPSLLTA